MGEVYNSIGVDPGASGAIAVIHGNRVTVFAMPVLLVKSGKTWKTRTDIPTLLTTVQSICGVYPDAPAYVEQVWGVKGQGAGTGAALGHQRGCVEMAFQAAGRPATLVSAQKWKFKAGLKGKPKSESVALAKRLWPEDAEQFTAKRGKLTEKACEGLAEAALIAKFGGMK